MSIRSLVESASKAIAYRAVCQRNDWHYQYAMFMHEGIMLTFERAIYRLVIVPLVAFLPAPLAYSIARLRGDWRYRWDKSKREEVMCCLERVFRDQLSWVELDHITRDFFRLRSCEAVDVMRLAGKGRALARLVEIRGLEHIEAALAAGQGAILASAHFGSTDSYFSLLGAYGFPITVVGRWVKGNRKAENESPIELFFSRFVHRNLVERHQHRPNIEPQAGQLVAAVQIATVLRHNELICTLLDPPPLPADRGRAVPMGFLNGQALLLPGAITIAQLTGAPVLMTFMHRSADWQHQVLEISPPMSLDGDVVTAFKRCLAVVEAFIRQNPAHWVFWDIPVLLDLGLLSEEAIKSP